MVRLYLLHRGVRIRSPRRWAGMRPNSLSMAISCRPLWLLLTLIVIWLSTSWRRRLTVGIRGSRRNFARKTRHALRRGPLSPLWGKLAILGTAR